MSLILKTQKPKFAQRFRGPRYWLLKFKATTHNQLKFSGWWWWQNHCNCCCT